MADSYRYRCGECGHRTSWGSESQGEKAIEEHYRRGHPAVVPGGMVEFRKGSSGGGGGGCLLALGILVVILIIASQH